MLKRVGSTTVISGDLRYTRTESPDGYFGDPRTLYLFGDNLARSGRRGQSNIRFAKNSIGIVTKRIPTEEDKSYLSDDDIEVIDGIVLSDIRRIQERCRSGHYDYLYIPSGGIGTGLAGLKEKSPLIFDLISLYLKRYLGYTNPGSEA